MRSPLRASALTLAALGLVLALAAPAGAAASTATVTKTVSKPVSAPGRYVVLVSVHARQRAEVVSVYVAGQPRRQIHVRAHRTTLLRYRLDVSSAQVAARVVSSAPTVDVSMTLTPAPTPAPAAPTAAPAPATAPPTSPAAPPAAAAAPAPPAQPAWTDPYQSDGKPPIFDDEFTGPAGSPPDPTKWTVTPGSGCGGAKLATTNPANATLDGAGHLALVMSQNGAGGYSAAQLDTNGHFSFEYGSVQASIEVPAGDGLCSAFWMVGNGPDGCWPGCGEIDIDEMLGQLPTTGIFTLHGPTTVPDGGNYQQFQAVAQSLPDLSAGFHTYGIVWTPDLITWTLDGLPYASEDRADLEAANGPGSWVYDQPFHLLLDVEVGNWQMNPDASTKFPATMLVDWVRVYQ